jgi:hypothetical protein
MLSAKIPEIRSLDLIRASFDWNSEERGSEVSPEHSYSVTVKSVYSYVFFCDITIRRQGGTHTNFSLLASYYCATDQSKDDDLAHAMVYHKALSETIIWSKFCEWAKFTLAQAAISNIRLPFLPQAVTVRAIDGQSTST